MPRIVSRHLKSAIHTSSPKITPAAVHTASWKGMTSARVRVVKATRVPAAPMTPSSAQNIHAGKKAPNNSKEGAPAMEQPVSMQLVAITRAGFRKDEPFTYFPTARAGVQIE